MAPSVLTDRPPVSLSMANKCRMMLYLKAHGYAEEETQPGAQRTFDMGTLIEAAMLRGVPIVFPTDDGGLEEKVIGPWWDQLGEVKDYATGKSFVAAPGQLSDFQRPVRWQGFVGHLDAILSIDTGRYVLDTKSASGFGYDKALTGELGTDTFAREYVGQVLAYREALVEEGEDIAGAILLYFNKEQSKVCARFIDPNPGLVAEMKERLSWANSPGEPEPDHVWIRGQGVPLRCGYCSMRASCGQVRGLDLELAFVKKARSSELSPVWMVK